jgi:hypothetical protein
LDDPSQNGDGAAAPAIDKIDAPEAPSIDDTKALRKHPIVAHPVESDVPQEWL